MDQESVVFDVAVIGLGMVGSAACRHISLGHSSVVGIGPGEPQDWNSHTGVFASHYDEGRITRIVDRDDVWSKLAARSIAAYGALEEESGIIFHHPVGSLRVTPFHKQKGDSLAAAYEVGQRNGAAVDLVEQFADLQEKFPYFQFEASHAGVMEHGGAGYINPRAMVRAQLEVAREHGAYLIPETVSGLEATDGGVTITTDRGRIVSAAKVLVCADAYSNFLIPGRKLMFQTNLVSVLLAEVSEEEVESLRGMPSIIWRLDNHPFFHSIYACPPVQYPDGKPYIKIGGTEWKPYVKELPEDFVEWFHSDGRQVETESLHEILIQILPHTPFKSFSRKSCIVTYTAHNYPYITALDDGGGKIFVATGGCGAAAKSSDEIGRMGARLVSDGLWTSDMEEHLFKGLFIHEDKPAVEWKEIL